GDLSRVFEQCRTSCARPGEQERGEPGPHGRGSPPREQMSPLLEHAEIPVLNGFTTAAPHERASRGAAKLTCSCADRSVTQPQHHSNGYVTEPQCRNRPFLRPEPAYSPGRNRPPHRPHPA